MTESTSQTMTAASFQINIAALGVQKTHELLREKKLQLISRARELEIELKALGKPLF